MKGMLSFGRRAAVKSTAAEWVEIANRCGTDQGPYMYYFWEHLRHLQSKPFTLMEIGIYQGASLATWKELFPRAQIHALDINPECARYEDLPRVKVTIGSQADPDTLERWASEVKGPIDVIIDDGSHVMEHLKISFMHLFPKLRSGGVYILEDLGTCYMPEYGGGLHHPGSMIELLKSFVDNINHHWSTTGNPLSISHMCFYTNICIVYKI
jgi:hypothetical protein